MTLSQLKILYENSCVDSFEVWQFLGKYTLTAKISGSTEQVDTARGTQKLYKNFETVLNDYKYITGQECTSIKLSHLK